MLLASEPPDPNPPSGRAKIKQHKHFRQRFQEFVVQAKVRETSQEASCNAETSCSIHNLGGNLKEASRFCRQTKPIPICAASWHESKISWLLSLQGRCTLVGGSSGLVEGSVDFLARTVTDRVSAPFESGTDRQQAFWCMLLDSLSQRKLTAVEENRELVETHAS